MYIKFLTWNKHSININTLISVPWKALNYLKIINFLPSTFLFCWLTLFSMIPKLLSQERTMKCFEVIKNIFLKSELNQIKIQESSLSWFVNFLTCTAMYKPGTLKDSNIISAVYSLFSGVFSGGSVYEI